MPEETPKKTVRVERKGEANGEQKQTIANILAKESTKAAEQSKAKVAEAMKPAEVKVVELPPPEEGPSFVDMVKQAQARTRRDFESGRLGLQVKRGKMQYPNRNPLNTEGK